MNNLQRSLGFLFLFTALTLAGGRAAEGDAAKKPGLGVPRFSPEGLEQVLTGDLALSADQKAKLVESWEKNVKPVREKMQAAADKEAKKAVYDDFKTAMDNYKASLKTILREEQFKVFAGEKPKTEAK